ncbi:hypothetical protein Kpol_2002p91 [Vanderwaltozyma polyspora DSM 70294]|uniref:Assembly factor CBP4 n=1 Tax=Vanderwaltozyma polyspora (strain ATCC 22028 / DSM 70294 / BCRC 21397 / CBS 2163 / NBRC 10782 / NRRL Y-8283 / UCD 57-17) TaxID=436907 RepID=CBP4_VANPO|nr:uncharacterized protein Kpol_2002p91 [Vanderwaltozyma polyspora DSM 70294]A7TFK6.1 RecName: Full=Assembly factor CBP4; AltName: Full=Cytochrome b mRNA-processing protein 4 [Vanderwaltozyma polyspora DSM 70294]EDO19020.1 hypothetical protein Kpol_2002p91 [Vanderwaltozyma polyspora DSM 70294]
MESPLWVRWLKVYAVGGVIIGSGALLFKYTTPTDEQLIASLSPELRLQYETERKLRQAEQQELMKIVQTTAESDQPIWKTGPIKSPWEKDTETVQQKEMFQKARADVAQREELQRIRKELAEIRQKSEQKTQEIVNTKSWWKFW